MKPESLVEKLKWRYATKKFDASREIPVEEWKALESSLVLSPSSFGLQPWKFIVVNDPAVREKLRAVSWNQSQVVEASRLVVFAIKKDLSAADVERYIRRVSQVRGVSAESLSSYRQMMLDFVARAGKGFDINAWSAQQLYIAMGVFMTAAAVLGIDTCPMEGLEPEPYDRILGLAPGYHTLAAVAAGYRAADDRTSRLAKVRYDEAEVVTRVGGKKK